MSQGSTISATLSVLGAANVVLTNVPCDASVFVGAVVRMNTGVAYNALADSADNSNMIGIAERKATSTLCDVRVLGVVSYDIYSGLDETKEYYLSDVTPGLITTTIPIAPGHIVLKVGQPYSTERMLVLKGIRMERT